MSNLVVIAFDNEHTAFEMRATLAKMQKEYLIERETHSNVVDKRQGRRTAQGSRRIISEKNQELKTANANGVFAWSKTDELTD